MATSGYWQRTVSPLALAEPWSADQQASTTRSVPGTSKVSMLLDALTVCLATVLATFLEIRTSSAIGLEEFWSKILVHGGTVGSLLGLFAGFVVALIVVSRRSNLYSPAKLGGFLHEQRMTVKACCSAGLLLMGAIYVLHIVEIPRSVLLMTLGLVTLFLSARRMAFRVWLYRRYDRGLGTRNVLIVGTGTEAQALRCHLDSIPHLGYTFRGFIEFPGSRASGVAPSADVLGRLDTLFQYARRLFIDEILFTRPPDPDMVHDVLKKAREHGVDLRLVPEVYDGLTLRFPIEYIGQFPTIPLHCGAVPEFALMAKRVLDVIFSSVVLLLVAPAMLMIALAIKLDSPGPVFYTSERIGKKGRVFKCRKFRTMVQDAEKRRREIMHMNERDGVLFKVRNDPRITRLGRFLRKYSLDELPQFFNVMAGDMSVVGPRPPIASEVQEYKLNHLRRLDVMPGITGLWQVQARQDPSFDSYISLDVSYIENWSVWLDIKIIVRTIGVVFAGTGS